MTKEFKCIKITSEDKIEFKSMDKEYGHAEWHFCPIWKRGRLQKILIYPKQQPDKFGTYYELEAQGQKEFQIMSYTHKGFDNPNIWMIHYCKEHKTVGYMVYADVRCNLMEFQTLSCFTIIFERAKEEMSIIDRNIYNLIPRPIYRGLQTSKIKGG